MRRGVASRPSRGTNSHASDNAGLARLVVMVEVAAGHEGCLQDFTPIERVLREGRVVDLGAFAPRTDPRRHELLVIVLGGTTLIT